MLNCMFELENQNKQYNFENRSHKIVDTHNIPSIHFENLQ